MRRIGESYKSVPVRILRLLGIVALLGAAVSLMLLLDKFRFGSQALFWYYARDAGHALLFGLMAVILLWLLQLSFGQRLGRLLQYSIAWLGVVGIGALSEYLQIATQRDADIIDWLRDIAGVTAFLALYFTIDSRLSDSERKHRNRAKTPIRIAALAILAVAGIQMVMGAVAYLHRQTSFPKMHTFDNYLERIFLEPSNAILEYVDPPDEWVGRTSQVAKVTFLPSKYTGLTFKEPYPDWRGYQALTLDVFSPLDSTLVLYISIYDCKNPHYRDRYNGELQIQPGYNDLTIPLTDIEHGPIRRRLDLSTIQVIHMFVFKPRQPLVLYFDDLFLE